MKGKERGSDRRSHPTHADVVIAGFDRHDGDSAALRSELRLFVLENVQCGRRCRSRLSFRTLWDFGDRR